MLPLLQVNMTESTNYLILGYVIICSVGLGYVISLWLRQRNLKRELDVIDRLQKEE